MDILLVSYFFLLIILEIIYIYISNKRTSYYQNNYLYIYLLFFLYFLFFFYLIYYASCALEILFWLFYLLTSLFYISVTLYFILLIYLLLFMSRARDTNWLFSINIFANKKNPTKNELFYKKKINNHINSQFEQEVKNGCISKKEFYSDRVEYLTTPLQKFFFSVPHLYINKDNILGLYKSFYLFIALPTALFISVTQPINCILLNTDNFHNEKFYFINSIRLWNFYMDNFFPLCIPMQSYQILNTTETKQIKKIAQLLFIYPSFQSEQNYNTNANKLIKKLLPITTITRSYIENQNKLFFKNSFFIAHKINYHLGYIHIYNIYLYYSYLTIFNPLVDCYLHKCAKKITKQHYYYLSQRKAQNSLHGF